MQSEDHRASSVHDEHAIVYVLRNFGYHVVLTIDVFQYVSTVLILFTPNSSLNILVFLNAYGAQVLSFAIALTLCVGCTGLSYVIYRNRDRLQDTYQFEAMRLSLLKHSIYSFYVLLLQSKFLLPYLMFMVYKNDAFAVREIRVSNLIGSAAAFVLIVTSEPYRLRQCKRFQHDANSDTQRDTGCACECLSVVYGALADIRNLGIDPRMQAALLSQFAWIYALFVSWSTCILLNDVISFFNSGTKSDTALDVSSEVRIMCGSAVFLFVTMYSDFINYEYGAEDRFTWIKVAICAWTGFFVFVSIDTFNQDERDGYNRSDDANTSKVIAYILTFAFISVVDACMYYCIVDTLQVRTLRERNCGTIWLSSLMSSQFWYALMTSPMWYMGLFLALLWLPQKIRMFTLSLENFGSFENTSNLVALLALFTAIAVALCTYSMCNFLSVRRARHFCGTFVIFMGACILRISSIVLFWLCLQVSIPFILFTAESYRNTESCIEYRSAIRSDAQLMDTPRYMNMKQSLQRHRWQYTPLLRLNESSIFGLGSSYRQKSMLGTFVSKFNVSQPSLSLQLGIGFRELELHVNYNSDTGIFMVYNMDVIDTGSSCNCLSSCLRQVRDWHRRNRDHSVIVIRIVPSGLHNSLRWCHNTNRHLVAAKRRLDDLLGLIRDTFEANELLTPMSLKRPRLWPSLRQAVNKIMFVWVTGRDENVQVGTIADTCRNTYELLPGASQKVMFTEVSHLSQMTNLTCCIREAATQYSRYYKKGKQYGLLTRLKLRERIDPLFSLCQSHLETTPLAFSTVFDQLGF
jgi:hypothetical protein